MGDLGWNQADVGAANRDPKMEIRQADFEATSQGYPEMKMWALQA